MSYHILQWSANRANRICVDCFDRSASEKPRYFSSRRPRQKDLYERGVKTFLIALAIVLAVAIGIGVVSFAFYANNQVTIVKVFAEQGKAARKFHDEIQRDQRLPVLQRALKNYAQELQSIDASSCPKDFRLAWFDFVSAVSDLSQKNIMASAIMDVFKVGMSAWTKDGKLTEDALKDTNIPGNVVECFRRCQRVAIAHGVSFRPAPNQTQN